MDRIERIKYMEEIFDKSSEVINKVMIALSDYSDIMDDLKELTSYYESSDWQKDYEEDEAGNLPRNLKRGVLSQDGVYNLLEENANLLDTLDDLLARSEE